MNIPNPAAIRKNNVPLTATAVVRLGSDEVTESANRIQSKANHPSNHKKEFVRTPLSHRSLENHADLQALRDSLPNRKIAKDRPKVEDAVIDGHTVSNKVIAYLKDVVEMGKYIDVSRGSERVLGISEFKLRQAIKVLTNRGYNIYYLHLEQLGESIKRSTTIVLTAKQTKFSEVIANKGDIRSLAIALPERKKLTSAQFANKMVGEGLSTEVIASKMRISELEVKELLLTEPTSVDRNEKE